MIRKENRIAFSVAISAAIISPAIQLQLAAQNNLVTNPGFEIYSKCAVFAPKQMSLATGWTEYCHSPDYFNTCASPGPVGVPINFMGHQIAFSGVGYAGFVALKAGGLEREIIGSTLLEPLVIGEKYDLKMKVSLAEDIYMGASDTAYYIPSNGVCMKFSGTAFSENNCAPINNSAHLRASSIIADTATWIEIKGSFIADSTYKYIMLGNFFDDSNTDTIWRARVIDSYFYVDDISVVRDTTYVNISGIDNVYKLKNLIVSPNPLKDVLYISTGNVESHNMSLSICDVFAKNVFTRNNFLPPKNFDLSFLEAGFYYLKLENGKEQGIIKLIKE